MTHYSLMALLHCVWVHCIFVQLQQSAVTTGPVCSWEQTSPSKTGMCSFDGLVEIRVRLGGKRICQRCEWIIAIDAVQRWHNFQSPIHLSAACVCAFGGKAKCVASSEHTREADDEVFPWHWAGAENKRRNHMSSFPHQLSLHVSLWQVEPQCASFTAHSQNTLQQQYVFIVWASGMKR